MTFKRHRVWNWFILGTKDGDRLPSSAYVMDDFGYLVETGNHAFYSLRAGD